MADTGIYTQFNPDIAEFVEEAFENSGMAPQDIGAAHIKAAKRSISFMVNSEWQLLGMRQWMITRTQYQVTAGQATFVLPVGAIDIFDAVLIRNTFATPINRMSRSEYLEIPNKTMTGRPDRYFVDRQSAEVTATFWRTPENSTDIIDYYYFRQMSRPGTLSNTLQMPPHASAAFVAGLAARLALKFAPDKFALLFGLYCGGSLQPGKVGGILQAALEEDRERADVALTVVLNPRGGRR
jgi:hypothetical protein